ncbi:MAG: nicotinate-nucleotide adenylyltransferase [Eubacteriales bacterium]|nr:nicotinate-nucleotide adenylyltransferase [Eubacteriales bacterium]
MQTKNAIGIMGGTFDPIHVGHLVIAETVRESLGLAEILFIPSNNPPHKDNLKITDASRRFEMVKLAVEDNPYFRASDIEISREGVTYTIDTLALLAGEYRNDRKYVYIIGADTVWDLVNWYKFDEVFGMCGFAAVQRQGYDLSRLKKRIGILERKYSADITYVEAPSVDISSTEIRARIESGKSIKYMVPDKVVKYIYENKLYLSKIEKLG